MGNYREVPHFPTLLFYILYKYLTSYFRKTITTHNFRILTLMLLMWRIGWASNSTSKWQMRFNSAFEGLKWVTLASLPPHKFALPSCRCYWLWEIKCYSVKVVSNNMIFMPHSWKPLRCCIKTPTYLLTPWCRVLLEKLISLQLVKKFPTFLWNPKAHHRTQSVRHLSLSWVSPIQSTYPHPTSWRSILI